jgi:hypothetical protein
VTIDPQAIEPWVKLGADALSALKSALPLLPKGEKREQVEKKIQAAERALDLAHAQAASALGYHLCKCTFPPQIKLAEPSGQMKCPRCGSLSGLVREAEKPRKRRLDAQQEAILKWIANAGNDGGYFPSLCADFRLHVARARVLLQPLFEAEYVIEREMDGMLFTGPAGDAYLVEHNLV